MTLQNGVVLTFWTRTVDAPTFPDRLQVRMSTNGASTNVGTTATDVGDFTTLLLDINPTYTTSWVPERLDTVHGHVEWDCFADSRSSGLALLCRERRTERSELRLHWNRHALDYWIVWTDTDTGTDATTDADTD